MFRKISCVFSFLSLLFLGACQKENVVDLPQATRSSTMLIYMDADNSLSENVEENLKQIMEGYSLIINEKTHLLIYLDDTDAVPLLFEVVKQNGIMQRKVIHTYEEQTSTSPTIMLEVMTEAYTQYVSDYHGLVLWSHGKSWIPADHTVEASPRENRQGLSYSWGNDMGYEINIPELAGVLSKLPIHLNQLIFDSCFMASIEVVYELRNVVDYIIASPIEILSFGFPYQTTIPTFFRYPSDPIKTAESFASFYDGEVHTVQDQGGTYTLKMQGAISVIKTAELEELAQHVKTILGATGDASKTVVTTRLQKYYRESSSAFCYDFLDYYHQFSSEASYASLVEILHRCIPYTKSTPKFIELTIDLKRYSGLASYVLEQYSTKYIWDFYYKNLAWAKAVGL